MKNTKRKKKTEKQKKQRDREQRQRILARKQTPWQMFLSNAKDSQITDLGISEIKNLKDKEYIIYLQRLADIANQRARILIDNGYGDVYSVQHYYRQKEFGTGNYNSRSEMIKEVNRINNFFNNSSSSIEGVSNMLSRAEKTLRERTGLNVDLQTQENRRKFFKIFDKFRKRMPIDIFGEYYQDFTEFAIDFMDDIDLENFDGDEDTQVVLELLNDFAEEKYIQFQRIKRQPLESEVELWNEIDSIIEKRLKYDY